MKIGRVFISGCIVYVAVAACSAMDPAADDDSVGAGASGHGVPGHASSSQSGAYGSSSSGASTGGIMDPVPPAHADPVSGARLKAVSWGGSDGSRVYVPWHWYDSALMVRCGPLVASDSTIRCMPSWGGDDAAMYIVGYYWSDASCGRPVARVNDCQTTLRFASTAPVTHDLGTCSAGASTHFYHIGARVAGPTYARNGAGACVATQAVPGSSSYELGAEMAPDEFVEMTYRIDP